MLSSVLANSMKGLEGRAGLPHAPKGMLSEVNTFFQLNEKFSLVPCIEQVVKDDKTCLGAQRSSGRGKPTAEGSSLWICILSAAIQMCVPVRSVWYA